MLHLAASLWRVLHCSEFCYQDCWNTASLIGSIPCRLKGQGDEHSSYRPLGLCKRVLLLSCVRVAWSGCDCDTTRKTADALSLVPTQDPPCPSFVFPSDTFQNLMNWWFHTFHRVSCFVIACCCILSCPVTVSGWRVFFHFEALASEGNRKVPLVQESAGEIMRSSKWTGASLWPAINNLYQIFLQFVIMVSSVAEYSSRLHWNDQYVYSI